MSTAKGEDMKLTREDISRLAWGNAKVELTYQAIEAVWQAIEADRDTIRTQAREELLKDHFKIGEGVIVEVSGGIKGTVCVCMAHKLSEHALTYGQSPVRRPTKQRPMTREDKIARLKEHFDKSKQWLPAELKDATLDDLCAVFEIPTEIEE